MVKPTQVVDSENLTTLFVVVSKFNVKEFETTYETLSNFVVGVCYWTVLPCTYAVGCQLPIHKLP